MNSFEQHDGKVIVRSDAEPDYIHRVADFEADSGGSAPELPAPYIGRVYEPGVRHFMVRPNGTQDPQSPDWPEGDTLIGRIIQLTTAAESRLNPTPNLAGYKTIKKDEARTLGRKRVFQDFDEQDQRRLAFLDPSDADRIACRDLIVAVRVEVNRVATLIGSRTSKALVDTAFASLNLPA